MSTRFGKCLCGAVRFRLSAEPLATRICWCRDCQHLAANGTVNIMVPTAALDIDGPTSEYTSTADSGNTMRRRFCPTCGSSLFANSSARPQFTVVRVGALERSLVRQADDEHLDQQRADMGLSRSDAGAGGAATRAAADRQPELTWCRVRR